MIRQTWHWQHSRSFFSVTVAGEGGENCEAESRASIAKALKMIADAGYKQEHIVRSRLWTRDRDARLTSSNVRKEMLADARRGASASFIAPALLPDASTMVIDITAVQPQSGSANKTVQEYDPPITPPMFVALDGMVFLSGNTSTAPSLAEQLTHIKDAIDKGLAASGAQWSDVVAFDVFLHETIEPAEAHATLKGIYPTVTCPLSMTAVAGYSAPEKLVEIEVTARLP